MSGTLSVVATPIGNLSDISARGLETLRTVDLILCEDTRVTKKLLSSYEISTPTKSFHQHSADRDIHEAVEVLETGKNIAIVSDAGTPNISDPGGKLVAAVHGAGLAVVAIPGPSAVVAALSVSGFPCEPYTFMGFPPHKKRRGQFLDTAVATPHTVVLYESNHRIKKLLSELQERLDPTRQLLVSREITKAFETHHRGTIDEILADEVVEKGEFVVVLEPGKN